MAIKTGTLVLGCDWCEFETSEFETETEAVEDGWWMTFGLVRGEAKEFAFCKIDCRDAHQEYYDE